MKIVYYFAIAVFVLASASIIRAQSNATDYAVPLTATVSASPAKITLHWKLGAHVLTQSVYRRELGTLGDWGTATMLKPTDSSYTDNTVAPNVTYEYRVLATNKSGTTTWSALGFIATGISVELPSQPGTVILLVDATYAYPLTFEISRLISDLRAEGWNVIRHDVRRTDSDTAIKTILRNDYENDPDHVRTLFILGHVPVPYSGDIAPDGHVPGSGNHQGAWPADVYYGNFDGDWTDQTINDTTAYDPRNKNVPGDGKFDQDAIDATMNLEVGRVDLYNMPAFAPLSDTALVKQYLDRDHAFRTGKLVAPNRALVDINFGVFQTYDVPGEDAWRNFPPLVGNDNIVNFKSVSSAGDWFEYLDTAKYLWAYGCGPGSWASSGGVGTTNQFASAGADAIFYMLFGSFFGDWDCQNNLTRAPLATKYGLTSCWVSRPFWYYHPLGMGQTFGYCTKLTQDDGVYSLDYVQGIAMGGVHVALMGDPTLRMQYPSDPPQALSASVVNGNSVKLTWSAPTLNQMSYNVYRAHATGDTLVMITPSPISTTSYTDNAPLKDSNIYVIRAVTLTTSPSGSYWNESGGISQGVVVPLAGVAPLAEDRPALRVTSDNGSITIHVSENIASAGRLSIVDLRGREVATVMDGVLSPGEYNYKVNTGAYMSGAYFVRLVTSGGIETAKILIP